ncbi:MAG TPA: ABC transporter ATP-binding protein, partial [Burkholderiales bacterium]
GGGSTMAPMAFVIVDRLRKVYQSRGTSQVVFDALSFALDRGEVVALLGESGGGKTTLLNLMSGIDTPDAGTVVFDGVAVHGLGEPARTLLRRERIGFVFQFFNLIPTLTVAENIALPLQLLGRSTQSAHEQVSRLLTETGLSGTGDRYPETLSGGEQQRAAIARALVHEPALLLADEPTGNLDEKTARRIIELLTGLVRRKGGTLLLVTHSEAVARSADRILSLRHGQVTAV